MAKCKSISVLPLQMNSLSSFSIASYGFPYTLVRDTLPSISWKLTFMILILQQSGGKNVESFHETKIQIIIPNFQCLTELGSPEIDCISNQISFDELAECKRDFLTRKKIFVFVIKNLSPRFCFYHTLIMIFEFFYNWQSSKPMQCVSHVTVPGGIE